MKTCTSCGTEKTLDAFHINRKGVGGRSSQCAACLSKKGRDRRDALYRADAVFTCGRAILKRQEYGTHVCLVSEASAYRAVAYMLDEFGMIRSEYATQYVPALDDIRLGREAKRIREQEEKDARASERAMARAQKAIEKAKAKAERKAKISSRAPDRDDVKAALFDRIRWHMKKQRRDRSGCALILARHGRTIDQAMKEMLGYTVDQLHDHIEAQFGRGMSWARFIAGDLHIDHILPASSFNLCDVRECLACYSMANLRPMKADANIRKGARVDFLL